MHEGGGAGSADGSNYAFLSCYELQVGWSCKDIASPLATTATWKFSPTGRGKLLIVLFVMWCISSHMLSYPLVLF